MINKSLEVPATKRIICILLAVLEVSCVPVLACTGFAVKSSQAWYGMNFDYSRIPFGVAILPGNGRKVFVMAFQKGGEYNVTVGMNEAGLFASGQLLYGGGKIVLADRDTGSLSMFQLFWDALQSMDRVSQVRETVARRHLADANPFQPCHYLFADPTGDAVVVESLGGENTVTEGENGFLAMTNFPNGKYRGMPYGEVEGVGADRYITAYKMLEQNTESFDLQKALAVLKATVQPNTAANPTLCSMAFDPVGGCVYVVFHQDFIHIWRVSLKEGSIETYAGFAENRSFPLGADGMLAAELVKYR